MAGFIYLDRIEYNQKFYCLHVKNCYFTSKVLLYQTLQTYFLKEDNKVSFLFQRTWLTIRR